MLEIGKTYEITTPCESFDTYQFENIKGVYKVLDKQENLYRMSPYQVELSTSDAYYCMEDVMGCLILLKIKKEYIIKEK